MDTSLIFSTAGTLISLCKIIKNVIEETSPSNVDLQSFGERVSSFADLLDSLEEKATASTISGNTKSFGDDQRLHEILKRAGRTLSNAVDKLTQKKNSSCVKRLIFGTLTDELTTWNRALDNSISCVKSYMLKYPTPMPSPS